ncbi:MAG: OB-fold nucleic acid binding domain-containing protein, partial [Xanthomonadales bacterium]|nr:OB-fold nucleic acid binding domain-containing protein [Xanthomonadales bacterium]
MSDETEHRLIAERRAKLGELREAGQAYPNDFRPEHTASPLHAEFGDLSKEELEQREIRVSVAGRMMAKRIMGKASFAHVQDRSGQIQLYVQRDVLPEGHYKQFKGWDVGDILGARGKLFKTNKGELSVWVDELHLLTKSLRPLPEKFHGLTDQ